MILLSICVVCVVYSYPPLLCLDFCQCFPIFFFCCQTLRLPTPASPHSTILPLAHLEVFTADSLPTCLVVTDEASPGSYGTEGSFTGSHSLTWSSHSRQFYPTLISWKPFPPRSCFLVRSATTCPHTVLLILMRCWCLFWFRTKKNRTQKLHPIEVERKTKP